MSIRVKQYKYTQYTALLYNYINTTNWVDTKNMHKIGIMLLISCQLILESLVNFVKNPNSNECKKILWYLNLKYQKLFEEK